MKRNEYGKGNNLLPDYCNIWNYKYHVNSFNRHDNALYKQWINSLVFLNLY